MHFLGFFVPQGECLKCLDRLSNTYPLMCQFQKSHIERSLKNLYLWEPSDVFRGILGLVDMRQAHFFSPQGTVDEVWRPNFVCLLDLANDLHVLSALQTLNTANSTFLRSDVICWPASEWKK